MYNVNTKLANRNYAMKYVRKENLAEEVNNLSSAILTLNPEFTPYTLTGDENKSELYETFMQYFGLYNDCLAAEEERAAAAAEAAETERWREERRIAREAAAKNKSVAPTADKPAKKSKKSAAAKVTEATTPVGNNSAQARLERYTAELAEKTAIANPTREVVKRIASLNRKIARANKALQS